MSVEIRELQAGDYADVRRLWESSAWLGLDETDAQPAIEAFLARNPGLSLVGVDGPQIVAAVLCSHDGRRGYLTHLAVAEGYRGVGLGRRLVRTCLDKLAALGIGRCNVRLFRDNDDAEAFYRRLGWRERVDLKVMTTRTTGDDVAPPLTRPTNPPLTANLERRPLYHVDAFTRRPFSGNPAAVCLVESACDKVWMQAVAADMNLSETAFVRPLEDGYELRWFTPSVEVDLCGHATLASAHVLWSQGIAPRNQPIVFHTRSGPLTSRRSVEQIELEFPRIDVTPTEAPTGLLSALGVSSAAVFRAGPDLLVELPNAAAVRATRPDFGLLRGIEARGVIVTAAADEEQCDFVSRFFGPRVGIDEDPVTGSADCALGPFWSARLNRASLLGYQASSRGGYVRVTVQPQCVLIAGAAVIVAEGQLLVACDAVQSDPHQ